MALARRDRGRFDADAWRRIGAVLDRVIDLDPRLRPHALEEACQAEGVRVEDVRPYLDVEDGSGQFPGRLDPAILNSALHALAADVQSARLAAGTRLGPYEILSLIGVGGMGEVYRARDTRLNRIVALKRVTARVAASPEGRKRFEREAQATSTLNHPHICTLHDVGEHEGIEFLVMEFAEGETLAAHLRRGALPMIDALGWAVQMADALAAAHRQGIVHRDLKPANVMITAHGVKLLDFGLAALRPPRGPHESGLAEGSTAAGTILGTLQYMAPEQLQGKPIDGRADIFSVGALLYEMLTGRKAFHADSAAGVVAAVLNHTPQSLKADRPDIPAALDWVVGQCLAKVAEERWHDAADLARQLRWIEASLTVVDPQPAFRSARGAIGWLAAAAAIAVLAVTYFSFQREPAGTRLSYRFEIPPPAGTSYEGLFAISPDGRRLAFTTTDAVGLRSLWIRPLEGLTAQRIESTNGALHPFWSPDGASVGFFADRKLKIVDLETGTVRIVSDTGAGGGGAWNANGVILFADESAATTRTPPMGLRRVSASGGVAAPVTRFAKDAKSVHAYPHFLPDGHHFLYMQLGMDEPGVYVGRLDADEPKRILPALVTLVAPQQVHVHGPVRATYAAGHLFYLDSKDLALTAQAFDVGRLQLTGGAVRVAENVENWEPGLSAYDVSATGALAYRPSSPTSGHVSQLTWFDRAGRQTGRLGDPGPYQNAALSHDGRYVLVERLVGRSRADAIVRVDVTSGTSSRFTQGQSPVWSPDGKWFAYTGGAGPFARVSSVEKGPGSELLRPSIQSWAGDWSTDGRHVVGTALRPGTGYDVFATIVGSGIATYPVASRLDETDPRLSPDGLWLAYAAADESKRWDVYVRPFEGPGGAVQVSRNGGRYPHWSVDGRELFYLSPDGTLMRTTVERRPTLAVTNSAALFRRPELSAGFNHVMSARPYLMDPDNQRFLVPVPIESSAQAPVVLVLTNWPVLVKH